MQMQVNKRNNKNDISMISIKKSLFKIAIIQVALLIKNFDCKVLS
jgi:hypothetical protein